MTDRRKVRYYPPGPSPPAGLKPAASRLPSGVSRLGANLPFRPIAALESVDQPEPGCNTRSLVYTLASCILSCTHSLIRSCGRAS